jgi:hypothetical protein
MSQSGLLFTNALSLWLTAPVKQQDSSLNPCQVGPSTHSTAYHHTVSDATSNRHAGEIVAVYEESWALGAVIVLSA